MRCPLPRSGPKSSSGQSRKRSRARCCTSRSRKRSRRFHRWPTGFRSYAAQGILERISALLFSRPEEYTLRDTLKLYAAIRAELAGAGRADLPFVANLDFGHSSPMGLLPLGCQLLLDPIAESLEITEAAVL